MRYLYHSQPPKAQGLLPTKEGSGDCKSKRMIMKFARHDSTVHGNSHASAVAARTRPAQDQAGQNASMKWEGGQESLPTPAKALAAIHGC